MGRCGPDNEMANTRMTVGAHHQQPEAFIINFLRDNYIGLAAHHLRFHFIAGSAQPNCSFLKAFHRPFWRHADGQQLAIYVSQGARVGQVFDRL